MSHLNYLGTAWFCWHPGIQWINLRLRLEIAQMVPMADAQSLQGQFPPLPHGQCASDGSTLGWWRNWLPWQPRRALGMVSLVNIFLGVSLP